MKTSIRLASLAVAVTGLAFAGAGAAARYQTTRPTTQPAQERNTVITVAKNAGSFNTLTRALRQAELVETLQGQGPFTVFAPDDKAFDKLPTGTLETLLKEDNQQQLKTVLLYHVASGKVTADKIVNLQEVESVEGSPIAIQVTDGKILLNDRIQITKTDVEADNGVIHIIDGVMIPPTTN